MVILEGIIQNELIVHEMNKPVALLFTLQNAVGRSVEFGAT